jgi:hypothetical protein
VNNELSVVKRRTRWRPEQVERYLAAYESSGQTQREFAQGAGLAYATFARWVRRRRQAAVAVTPARWVPVEVKAERRRGVGYQVQCADGTSVRIPEGFDAAEVRQLLELLCSR